MDKQKKLIGMAVIKRIPGEPSNKTGLAAVFASSTDSYVVTEKYFAPEFDSEERFFDENLISHFKDTVSLGQVKEAEYFDKVVSKIEKKNIWGITFTQLTFFIAMLVVWGMIFHNIGLGIIYAFLFSTCFTTVTSRVEAKETDKTIYIAGDVNV